MDTDSFFAMISTVLPLQRFGKPPEMGGICTFLASDDSSFMTGAALIIDAGTAVVDVLGASIMGALKRGGVIP
jgi:NAD(P)-dependent dehydrogenase (short-subunit alcohol dehydrogenase family)